MINIFISKSNSSLSVDWDKMPENAQRHIIEYGLKQKLNDAGASATKKELGDDAGAQALALAENVLAALMEGKVTVRQAAASLSLEEKAFNRLANALYKKVFGQKAEEDTDIIPALAKKLNKDEAEVTLALEKKAKVEADIQRKIQTLKAQTPDIDL